MGCHDWMLLRWNVRRLLCFILSSVATLFDGADKLFSQYPESFKFLHSDFSSQTFGMTLRANSRDDKFLSVRVEVCVNLRTVHCKLQNPEVWLMELGLYCAGTSVNCHSSNVHSTGLGMPLCNKSNKTSNNWLNTECLCCAFLKVVVKHSKTQVCLWYLQQETKFPLLYPFRRLY